MPSIGGITEIIGVRAVIIDVRQYLADGREIERTNDRITASELRLQKASEKAGVSVKTAQATRDRANESFKAAIQSREKLIKLENQLATAQNVAAKAKPPVSSGLEDTKGRPIPSAVNAVDAGTAAAAARASADIPKLKQEIKEATAEFKALGAAAIVAGNAEHTAGVIAIRDLDAKTVATERLAAAKAQLKAAEASQLRAATTAGTLIGAAVVGGVAASAITSAAKYQQELSKINVLTSVTDKETEELGKKFLELSTQIPVNASDLAAAAYLALSSGIKDVGTALELTTIAAKAAVAGQADIRSIVSAVTTILNDYPKGAITATQASEVLFATVREGKGEFNDLANSIGRVIPSAVAMGVKLTEIGAAMAVLTNGGLNAEEAATALRAILQDLASNDTSTQTIKALNAIGLTSEQLRQNIKDKGLTQALVELFDIFGRSIPLIEPIIPNVRALTGAFIAFGDSGKKLADINKGIENSVGIIGQSFDKVKDNAANVATIFKNNLNVALIEVGNAVLPAVTKALQDLVKWFQANRAEIVTFVSQGLQAIIGIAKSVASSLGDIAKILVSVYRGLKAISEAGTGAKLAILGIGAAFLAASSGARSFALALVSGPIAKLTLLLIALDKVKEGIDLPVLGQTGGVQKPTGERGLFGQPTVQGEVANILKGEPLADKILGAITPAFLKSDEYKKAQSIVDQLRKEGINTFEQFAKLTKGDLFRVGAITLEEFAAGAKGVKQETDLANQDLPDFEANIKGVSKAAEDAAERVKKAAEAFKSSSEAAGQVESLTVALKKFGTISFQDAGDLGLSAAQAGQVQGVDAVIRSQERSKAEAFNYVEAINAVSGAFQRSAAVGRELLLSLAQAALSASQTALSNVFSRPTREVANLNVSLAQRQGATANLQFRNGPQIRALNDQLKNIDRQIAAQNRANAQANRAAERAKRDQERAQRAAEKAQQAIVDQQKLANLQAQINAERQLAALQKLIDATTKQQSDLQETFKKNNEELRKKFFEFTAAGDEAGALGVLDEQQKLTKSYHDQNNALTQQAQQQQTQLKQAQEAEQERQRQVQLANALFESQQKQKESTDDLSSSIDDAKEAQDAQNQALQDSKDKIQEQIDALQGPIDKSKEQEQAIQEQIAVYEAGTNILKAFGVAADKTLLTQAQQFEAAKHFTEQISFASGQAQILAKSFYDFIPGAKEADTAFKTLKGAVEAVNLGLSPGLTGTFDAVAAHADIMRKATEDLVATQKANEDNAKAARDKVNATISNWQTEQEQYLVGLQSNLSNFTTGIQANISNNSTGLDKAFTFLKDTIKSSATSVGNSLLNSLGGLFKGLIPKHATGGIFTKATLGIIGEAGPEAVLPLNDVKRVQQILAQASSYTTAGAVATSGSLGSSNIGLFENLIDQFSSKATGRGTTGPGTGGGAVGTFSRSKGEPGFFDDLGANVDYAKQMLRDEFIRLGYSQINFGNGLEPVGSLSGGARSATGPGPSSSTGTFGRAASSQMIVQMSPALTTALATATQPAPAVFAPNISVTGATLDSMEATAIAAVQKAFRDARISSGRQGGLIGQNIGPSY